jgi:hypothetical protein
MIEENRTLTFSDLQGKVRPPSMWTAPIGTHRPPQVLQYSARFHAYEFLSEPPPCSWPIVYLRSPNRSLLP